MKYRDFLTLTDDEIRFIVQEIFDPVKIENIQRDAECREIVCDITTDGWSDGETESFPIMDELILREPSAMSCGICVDFSIDASEKKKWRQFCIAKGCHPDFKDNPFLME